MRADRSKFPQSTIRHLQPCLRNRDGSRGWTLGSLEMALLHRHFMVFAGCSFLLLGCWETIVRGEELAILCFVSGISLFEGIYDVI